ncbi:MAG: hypothetical protein ABFC56_03105 [Clostridiaceae bacterium]
MISILIGLGWLKFIDPLLMENHIYVGISISLLAGSAYFITGICKMVRIKKLEKELEKKAYAEMMQQLGAEVRHD